MVKPKCKYGSSCYRKNPKHLDEYDHDFEELSQEKEEKVKQGKKRPSELEEVVKKNAPAVQTSKKQPTIQGFFKRQKTSDEPKQSTSKDGVQKKKEETVEDLNKKRESEKDTATPKGKTKKKITLVKHKKQEDHGDGAQEKAACRDQLRSIEDVKDLAKEHLKVEFPNDFYDFWEFASSLNHEQPCIAFEATVKAHLAGPYDLFWVDDVTQVNWLCHSRFYYDPPEFTTIMEMQDGSKFHMGYFRDDPSESPVFVASNDAEVDGKITARGGNMFSAIKWFLEDRNKKLNSSALSKIIKSLVSFAEDKNYDLSPRDKKMKDRDRKVVTKTFHGAGLVVPVDDNEIGYRELPHSPGELRSILEKIQKAKTDTDKDKAMDPLMETIMLVQFANDECDYGEGIELGLDLFTFGDPYLHSQVANLLPLGYKLVGRDLYADIMEAHLSNRTEKL